MQTFVRYDRDLRIDFFRGIALWSIFIDHLIKGSLGALTFRQYGFCDSAELFVLLSGISAGMVYGKTAVRRGVAAARRKVFFRIGVLYRTHLIMIVASLAEAGLLLAWLKPPYFLQFYGLEPFVLHHYRSLWNAALLRFQPENLDILPLYIVLLALFLVALPYMFRWPRVTLALSVALYAATRMFHLALPGWPGFFNPLAWQVVFVIGVLSSSLLIHRQYWTGWDVLAALFAVFSLLASHAVHSVRFAFLWAWIPPWPDKPNLHPLRLLAILALAWLAWRYIPATAKWLRSRWSAPVILLGQHSLPVFVMSVFLSMAGEAWFSLHTDRASQIIIQVMGTIAMLGVAAWGSWQGRQSRLRAALAPRSELPSVNVA